MPRLFAALAALLIPFVPLIVTAQGTWRVYLPLVRNEPVGPPNTEQGTRRVYLPLVQNRPASPPATDPPMEQGVRVVSHSSYRTSSMFAIVGEVESSVLGSVWNVRISAKYYNTAGQLVAVDDDYGYGYTFLTETRRTQRNPFAVYLPDAPADIDRYELTVDWQSVPSPTHRAVTVLSQQVRQLSSGLEVFGEVRNDGGRKLCSIQVVVTFYDAAGTVVYVASSYAKELAPGATTIYKVSTRFWEFPFETYRVQAEGYEATYCGRP